MPAAFAIRQSETILAICSHLKKAIVVWEARASIEANRHIVRDSFKFKKRCPRSVSADDKRPCIAAVRDEEDCSLLDFLAAPSSGDAKKMLY
jgi:hypothetical protein